MYSQEAASLIAGRNFEKASIRYRLPEEKLNTSVFLITGSFEYDIELIKKLPPPKDTYRTIVIPTSERFQFGNSKGTYSMSKSEYSNDIMYLQKSGLRLKPRISPIPSSITENVYVSFSNIIKVMNDNIRDMSDDYLKVSSVDLFFNVIDQKFGFSKKRVFIIDTKRYRISKTVNSASIHNDIIGAIMMYYLITPPNKISRRDVIFVFRAPDGDYKFDLSTYDATHDGARMMHMLRTIGYDTATTTYEESYASVDDFFSEEDESQVDDNPDTNNKPAEVEDDSTDEVVEKDNDITEKPDTVKGLKPNVSDLEISEDQIKAVQNNKSSAISSLRATINAIGTDRGKKKQEKEVRTTIDDAKIIKINAQLLSKINPNTEKIGNYETIADDLKSTGDDPVENNILDDASRIASQTLVPTDSKSADNTTSSPREFTIKKIMGTLKVDKATIDSFTSVTDIARSEPDKPRNITTTNPAAMKGSSFPNIAKDYEDKLLDSDMVATFMKLQDLPDGFIVKDVEVTDISSVTSLINEWKITLDNKKTGRKSTLKVRVPKLINGKIYSNGVWYNIGKQDFPIPILKINSKTVILTSNYGKITVDRYDTKSLVDISIMAKIIKAESKEDGSNKYVKMGSSVSTNSRFESTIEYDEYAKRWLNFKINTKEIQATILFNRQQCANQYGFVAVNADEFCCGMINNVPVIVNVNSGLTRQGKSLTETMLELLPAELRSVYYKTKPGKLSMYAQIYVLKSKMPLGVVVAAWEGITSLLEKSKAKYQLVDKSFSDPKYFTIPFKDKILAIENTVQNQLLFNGFYRVSTKSNNMSEFDIPIHDVNSIWVDVFNQLFFKKYSDLTAFITTYNFYVDAITSDVCLHYKLPNQLCDMLIYASWLLADNSHNSEYNSSYYRIRSSEIIPAIVHYHLAMAISKYNNTAGSRSKTNVLMMNPNEVVQEIINVNTVRQLSALNPVIELHQREEVSNMGFMGLNQEKSYNRERRAYDPTMIGKIALSSPNSGNVGINRQMVIDPKIDSVRGYTSIKDIDENYNDFQLASFSEMLTPGSVSRDDAIRTAIATSQSGHIVATDGAQPVLISNGTDEVVPSYLSDEFSYVARMDGKVLEFENGYMIIQYKDGKKSAVRCMTDHYAFNSGSGFYVNNKLITELKPGESFKKGDVLAYHEKFFSKGTDGVVRMNVGPLAKVAFTTAYCTYEDAGMITQNMSKKMASSLTMCQSTKIAATDDIDFIVKVGDEVEIGDPLITFGLGDTGDKSVDAFLKAFQSTSEDAFKRKFTSKYAGRIADVRMYTCKSLDRLSPSLFKLFTEYFKENKKKRAILDRHDSTNTPYKLDTLYALPTEPLKTQTIKGINCDVFIEILIEHEDEVSTGDKIVLYSANKQIISDVIPEGLEPYSEFRPDEEVSVFGSPSSILKRMIPSIIITAAGNKVLIETKRKMKEIWEGKE